MKRSMRYRNRAIAAYKEGGKNALSKMILRERPTEQDVKGLVSSALRQLGEDDVENILDVLKVMGLRRQKNFQRNNTAKVQVDVDGCAWIRVGVGPLGLSKGDIANLTLTDDGEIVVSR